MSDIDNLIETAEMIEGATSTGTSPVEVARSGVRLTAGSERGDAPMKHDPATFMPRVDPDTPKLEQSPSRTGGGGQHARYVLPTGLSRLHGLVYEAVRRDEAATAGETEEAVAAWATFTEAAEEARRITHELPLAAQRGAASRAEALAAATEPIVLPSVADVVAFEERRAADTLQRALDLRAEYDRVVEATAGDRLETLAEVVPREAAEIKAAVDDLEARIRRMRCGVDALIDAAMSPSEGIGRAPMPSTADLSSLASIVAEVDGLVEVANNPTQPILTPSLRDRQTIAHLGSQGTMFTEDYVALAVREEDEQYVHTRLAIGVPAAVRESYRRDGFYRAGGL